MKGQNADNRPRNRAAEKEPMSGRKILLLAAGAFILIALLLHTPIFIEMANRRWDGFAEQILAPYGCAAEDVSRLAVHFREEGENGIGEHLAFRSEDPAVFAPIVERLLSLNVSAVAPSRLYSWEPPGRPVWADIVSAHLPFGIGESLLPEKKDVEDYFDRSIELYFLEDVYVVKLQFADPYYFCLDVQYRSVERENVTAVFQSEQPLDLDFIRSFLQTET